MELRFLLPQALWLLLLVPLPLLFPRRTGPLRPALWRALALTLVVLGLARPVHERADTREHHVFALDASASADADAVTRARALRSAWRAALPSDAVVSTVIVGSPAAASEPDAEEVGVRLRPSDRSPLADLLAQAALAIPDGARGAITLASDGADTDGGWEAVASDLTQRGIPVHVVALEPRGGARPLRLGPVAPARVGGTARVAFEVVAGGGGEAAFEYELEVDGSVEASGAASTVGGRARVVCELEPERAGFLPLVVRLSGPDVDPAAVHLEGVLPVDEPLRALHLGPGATPDDDASRRAALSSLVGRGFELVPPAGGALEPDAYDLVVLDDRPAAALPTGLAQALAEAVRDEGLGLFACGARQAFGAGGWQDTALADVLPVEALQKEEKRDPSVALAIVIDTSGSMGGNRVQLAKETARLAMRRLLPHDKVGIVEFYGAKRWAAPIQPASSNVIEIQRALNRLAGRAAARSSCPRSRRPTTASSNVARATSTCSC